MKIQSYVIWLSVVGIILWMGGCTETHQRQQAARPSYRSYYYPIELLKKPLVYHYAPLEEGLEHLYWILKTVEEKETTFLITEAYTQDSLGYLKPIEWIKEEINEVGAFMKAYKETQYNDTGKAFRVAAEIIHPTIFVWKLRKNRPLIWRFKGRDSETNYLVETKKTRKFQGDSVTVRFEGETREAIVLQDYFEIRIESDTQAVLAPFTFEQKNYYVKGIGLYKYIRKLPKVQQTYILKEILSLEEWNKRKSQSF
ncbi:MAG: hypothetical protein ACFB0B_00635 [Thermonemataceae bacterium]